MSEMTGISTNQLAEEQLIGAMLIYGVASIERHVGPEHFYDPSLQRIYVEASRLHDANEPETPEVIGLADGCDPYQLTNLLCDAAPESSIPKLAAAVVTASDRRKMATLGEQILRQSAIVDDPYHMWSSLTERFTPGGGIEHEPAPMLADLMAREFEVESEWVVPSVLRPGWRMMLVAAEGLGKSTLLRQMAVAVGYGIHPFANDLAIKPRKTMIIDVENPPEIIQAEIRPMVDAGEHNDAGTGGIHNIALESLTAGVDLRDRRDRLRLEGFFDDHRPELLVIGPLYKMYRSRPGENDEQVAKEIQDILDDWRRKYGMAILIEHHAPHGSGGSLRQWRPAGSSLWLRWPELGLFLAVSDRGRRYTDLSHWRYPRTSVELPSQLSWASTRGAMPFAATFDERPRFRDEVA